MWTHVDSCFAAAMDPISGDQTVLPLYIAHATLTKLFAHATLDGKVEVETVTVWDLPMGCIRYQFLCPLPPPPPLGYVW